LTALLERFSTWYLSALDQGGYWLIGALMALESTIVPIPSETIVPPAAYLARTHGGLSIAGVVVAATLGSWVGASVMYWGARWLGRPLVMRLAPYLGLSVSKIELAERWSAHYGWPGVFFSRLLPVIRHLIGIPAGILRLDFRWYAAASLAGSLLWCSVLAWLGATVGDHPELLKGSLHRFLLLVLAVVAVLGALYYVFVQRPGGRRAARELARAGGGAGGAPIGSFAKIAAVAASILVVAFGPWRSEMVSLTAPCQIALCARASNTSTTIRVSFSTQGPSYPQPPPQP
jgi:membrane protein DedA with SNARE-associated domain